MDVRASNPIMVYVSDWFWYLWRAIRPDFVFMVRGVAGGIFDVGGFMAICDLFAFVDDASHPADVR